MIGRPPTCTCETCRKCKARVLARARYQRMTMEERRAWVARRDAEKSRARDRERYRSDYEKRRAAMDAYAQTPTGREALRRGSRAWSERNPEKRIAVNAVNNAVRDGRLRKHPCEICGDPKSDGHHSNYSKPLEVTWLCRKHHTEVHLMMRAFAA